MLSVVGVKDKESFNLAYSIMTGAGNVKEAYENCVKAQGKEICQVEVLNALIETEIAAQKNYDVARIIFEQPKRLFAISDDEQLLHIKKEEVEHQVILEGIRNKKVAELASYLKSRYPELNYQPKA